MTELDGPRYKVVLVFNLAAGRADEEVRRSTADGSFPALLSGQPGFVSMVLVRVDDSRTLSIQTWRSERDWWAALETAKAQAEGQSGRREEILVSREFFAGTVVAERIP